MFDLNGRLLALAALVAAVNPTKGFSEIVYTFTDGGILDGATKDHTAEFPEDSLSGIVGTITTLEVVQSDGNTGGTLNENTNKLGINNPDGSANDRFSGTASWTFSWDVDTTLDFIDFDALKTEQTFLLQSPDWVDKSFTSSETQLTFDKDAGEFTFADKGTDEFDFTSIITGDSLLVSANTPYTFLFDDGGGDRDAGIAAFTFSAPASASATGVPEPGSAVALLGLAGAAVGRRWHRKRKTQRESRTDGL